MEKHNSEVDTRNEGEQVEYGLLICPSCLGLGQYEIVDEGGAVEVTCVQCKGEGVLEQPLNDFPF
jgi:DnaJ-class molecular chaperone